jgi:S1-C subfamily serine protease
MSSNTLQVSAPVDTNSAGRGGQVAMQSVFRIICRDTNSSGTGFLHGSGKIITAEHVIQNSSQPELLFQDGSSVELSLSSSDSDLDIALLSPNSPVTGNSLPISRTNQYSIGAHVSTWGFPGGYRGLAPLLSVGYLSGTATQPTSSGQSIQKLVVNAAFNSGNSGGPLLHIESGAVMGVVSSKLAPISAQSHSALAALANQQSGFMYTGTDANGVETQVSEGQIVASILNELRGQVQLVIGMATTTEQLSDFLTTNGLSV